MATISRASEPRVVAVVVAWNRQDLLHQCLNGLSQQTRRPNAVLVVDNASTDNSRQIAAAHPIVDQIVSLPTNTGGAGGFTAGIAVAIHQLNADLVWIMDDDTVPTAHALEPLLAARNDYCRPVALLASRADWHDGREHPMNTPRTRIDARAFQRHDAARIGCRPIRSASFVSILISADAIRSSGLPIAAYFLWNDDFEYTSRLLRNREGLYVPASRVIHLTKTFGDSRADPGKRFYNEVRNKTWLFTRSSALKAWERLIYGSSTLLRWIHTLFAAKDRTTLLSGLYRGLRDGLLHSPRPNYLIFAGIPVADDIDAIEVNR